jgi:ubiquinol-cytochrome c reductase cytochrome c subunit
MRHQMVRFAVVALAVGVILGYSPAFAAGDAAKGKAAFVKHGCWQCHGYEGQGSVATSNSKMLAPDPLPWEGFSAFIRTSNTGMPPYSEKILPNGELEDIYAYLSSIPKPKDHKNIPLLAQ